MRHPTITLVTIATISLLLSNMGCREAQTGSPVESSQGQGDVQYAPIPASILTPDTVDTRLGKLRFFDGLPDEATVKKAYDNLDFQRGVRAFLDGIPISSLHAMREGLRKAGTTGDTIGIWEDLMDSKTLFLTGNTESVYVF
jgi:hypothetical protein